MLSRSSSRTTSLSEALFSHRKQLLRNSYECLQVVLVGVPKPESSRSQNTASRSSVGSPSTVRLEIVPLFNLGIVRFLSLRYSGRMSAPMLSATLAVDARTEARAR